jgi:AbrB family looped-hinge helix DNA binding protein
MSPFPDDPAAREHPLVILLSMTRRVGPKGQVVIPKAIRDRMGIAPGDEVVFLEDGDAVRLKRARGLRALAGTLGGIGVAARLEEEHRRDLERERRRRW